MKIRCKNYKHSVVELRIQSISLPPLKPTLRLIITKELQGMAVFFLFVVSFIE